MTNPLETRLARVGSIAARPRKHAETMPLRMPAAIKAIHTLFPRLRVSR
jgi:hypothetical protein